MGFENGLKSLQGRLDAFQDAKAMARKAEEEKELRAKVVADSALADQSSNLITPGDNFWIVHIIAPES